MKRSRKEVDEVPKSGEDQQARHLKSSSSLKNPVRDGKDRAEEIKKGRAAAHMKWQSFAEKRGADRNSAWREKQEK